MSHELRTPLNGILGYAQLLARSEELSPSSLRSVEAIEHCGDHLLMLISEILDLAKIEAGRLELESSTFELHEFLTSVADIARLGATQAGLIFSHETRSALPHVVTADRNKLRQILFHLLRNPAAFLPNGYLGPRRRVLIADDNADNRQVLGQFLRSLGFDVSEAHNGVQAVQTARNIRPDLILMDLVMPIKDGFQATRDIRDSADIAGTPIIAISASAFPTTRVQCADAGCQAFITKPVRLEEVSALLVKVLNVEWTYAPDAALSKMPAPRSPGAPPLTALPKDALPDDYQIARSGDVHRLEQRLLELRANSSGMEPAVDALLRCVSEFDMTRLRALLQPLIEGAA